MSIHSISASANSRSRARFAALAALIPIVTFAACDAATPTESSTRRTVAPASALASSATTAGADRYVYEALHDLEGSELFVECADGGVSESVVLTGKIFERFAVVLDPAGGERSVYHTMPVGLAGVGATSGEEFRGSWRDHGVFNQTSMGMTSSFRYTLKFVGLSSKRSFSAVSQGHFTLNANGEVAVSREKLVAECGG